MGAGAGRDQHREAGVREAQPEGSGWASGTRKLGMSGAMPRLVCRRRSGCPLHEPVVDCSTQWCPHVSALLFLQPELGRVYLGWWWVPCRTSQCIPWGSVCLLCGAVWPPPHRSGSSVSCVQCVLVDRTGAFLSQSPPQLGAESGALVPAWPGAGATPASAVTSLGDLAHLLSWCHPVGTVPFGERCVCDLLSPWQRIRVTWGGPEY